MALLLSLFSYPSINGEDVFNVFQQKGQGQPYNMHKQFMLIRTKTECFLKDEVYLSHGRGTLNSILLGQEWLPCHEASAVLVHLLSIDVCGTRHMQGPVQ